MRTVIVGGGRIGRYLAKELDDFVIIERERVRAENLARGLGEEHVIQGDGADRNVLERAGVRKADALLAITNIDRTNLEVALVAKELGVPRVIARCDDPSFIEVMHYEGVDNVICPALTASRMIHSTLFHDVEEVTSIHVVKGSVLDGIRLGDIKSVTGTRALGVIRRKDLLKPDPDLPVRAGDEVLLCSIGGLSPELRNLMARETNGLLPFSNIVVVILKEEQIETVGDEGLYLSAHLGRIPVEVHCPFKELPARMRDLAQIWDVSVKHTITTETEDLSYLRYRQSDKGAIVLLPPGKVTERSLFRECELGRLLGITGARVLLSRRKIPYRRMLAVYDGSEESLDLAELALKVAIHTGSILHVFNISDLEAPVPDLEAIRRLGKSRGVEVEELHVEGNPTLDLVALVTKGDYDVLAIKWSCQNVRKDILRKVVEESRLSVLLVA